MKNELFPDLRQYLEASDFERLTPERLSLLEPIIAFGREEWTAGRSLVLNCICTHNSRRSHLTQVWAQAAADYYGIPLTSYSGGTEATALYPAILETLQAAGFHCQTLAKGANPIYALRTGPNTIPIIGFSKRYEHPFNPQTGFIALMTCSSADEGCPIVLGAKARFPLRYIDPKHADGTPDQAAVYAERCRQIATEMMYVMSQIQTPIK
jgi:arsenate reductase